MTPLPAPLHPSPTEPTPDASDPTADLAGVEPQHAQPTRLRKEHDVAPSRLARARHRRWDHHTSVVALLTEEAGR
jgi:hypothetical protein